MSYRPRRPTTHTRSGGIQGAPVRITLKTFLILLTVLGVTIGGYLVLVPGATANPSVWQFEWPNTDFSKASVDFDEILSGGPPKDGIPSIDAPKFVPVSEMTELGPHGYFWVLGLIHGAVAVYAGVRIAVRDGIPVAAQRSFAMLPARTGSALALLGRRRRPRRKHHAPHS